MRSSLALILVAVLTPVLAACGEGGVNSVSTRPAKARVANLPKVRKPAPPAAPPVARIQTVPGLEGVIGATASDLSRTFGPPRLDVIEGDVRKLQFTGKPCVLDVFLYPLPSSREPRATYVDARRASDGRDVDRAACVAGLKRH